MPNRSHFVPTQPPAALVSRGTGRLPCPARQQRSADCLCLFRECEPGRRSALQPHLTLKPRILQRAFGHEQQAIGLERLFDEIIGAAFDRGCRGFDVAMTRNHDDREFGMLLLEAVEQLQTIKPAAFEPNIEENEIRPARHHGGKRLVAVAGHAAAMALVLQNAGDQLADIRLIVDDQDIGCHRVRNN
jgi:hypothetical protein